jgi:hypothetical protein
VDLALDLHGLSISHPKAANQRRWPFVTNKQILDALLWILGPADFNDAVGKLDDINGGFSGEWCRFARQDAVAVSPPDADLTFATAPFDF